MKCQMKCKMIAMVLGSLGTALCGCMGADPATDTTEPSADSPSADPAAILKITVEPGHTVGFFEPSPGALYLAESTTPGQAFVLQGKAQLDALDAFAQLRPGQAVPAELQAAYDRARSVPSDTGPRANGVGGGRPDGGQATPGVIQQGLTSSSSGANFVDTDDGCKWGPQFSFCRINWANGFFAFASPTTSGSCLVDHYAGNGVTIQITAGSSVTTTFQAVHTVVRYALGTPGSSVNRRIDILNASGDSFHAGCNWGN